MVTDDRSREWDVTSEGNQYLLELRDDGLSLTRNDNGDSAEWTWAALSSVTFPTGFSVRLTTAEGQDMSVGFTAGSLQREFRSALESARQETGTPGPAIEPRSSPFVRSTIGPDRVTTLPGFPGHDIVQVHGVVTELASSSGWTASSKGNNALTAAMTNLRGSAEAMNANAVVGLSATTFGAHGGITSGFGGDAVGVLLLGTAVTIRVNDLVIPPLPEF